MEVKGEIYANELQKYQENAVTYSFSGGRLGDNLMAYFHAKWIAHKYHLLFLYKPFPHSDAFHLSLRDTPFTSEAAFENLITIRNESQITSSPSSTLFIVPYFPESHFEYEMLDLTWAPYFKVDWEDPFFKAEVKASLEPIHPVETLPLQKKHLTIGVHIRRGGGKDGPETYTLFPLKFPPDQYYIDQIKRVARLFKHQDLHIHLLTDDLTPSAIAKKFEQALKNKRLHFFYRAKGNGPDSHILEDFYLIPKFDCLILCQSNFSLVASKLGRHRLVITPEHAVIQENQVIIDQIEMKLDGKTFLINAKKPLRI